MSVTVERVPRAPHVKASMSLRGRRSAVGSASLDEQSAASLLIVEEKDVARCGLKLIMCSQRWVRGCASAATVERAVELIGHSSPDVILYGARPRLDGAQQAGRELRAAAPASVLVLMSASDRVSAQTLNLVGAVAHVSRNAAAPEIVMGVRMASLGLSLRDPTAPAVLSTRQLEVLDLLAAGQTNGEIGERLYLSAHTVKQHTCAIYRKLQVRNRAEAIQCAQGLGLLA